MAYSLIIRDADDDVHRVSCRDKGEALNWIAKFVDEFNTEMTSIYISLANMGESNVGEREAKHGRPAQDSSDE